MHFKSYRRPLCGVFAACVLIATVTFSFGQSQSIHEKKNEGNPTKPVTVVPAKDEKILRDPAAGQSGEKVAINVSEASQAPPVVPIAEAINEKAVAPKKQVTDSEWHVASLAYIYFTGLDGRIGARGRTLDIDLSVGDVLGDFRMGFMGAFEVRKNKFVFVNDIMWNRLGEDRTNTGPAAPFSFTDVRVGMFTWDPEVGYRIAEGKAGSFDILGGFRLMSIENELETESGLLPGFHVSQRKTWATPVGGFHGVLNVHPKVFLSTKFDIGGGWGADNTTQIYAGMGYRLNPKFALVGGYRFLSTNYDDESGYVFDTTMNGLVFGARINIR